MPMLPGLLSSVVSQHKSTSPPRVRTRRLAAAFTADYLDPELNYRVVQGEPVYHDSVVRTAPRVVSSRSRPSTPHVPSPCEATPQVYYAKPAPQMHVGGTAALSAVAATVANSHMLLEERRLVMDDVQRDLENRLSSFFNEHLIPVARKAISEMPKSVASEETASFTDDELGSVKDQMHRIVAESAGFRVQLQALNSQVDNLRAECPELRVESITAMVRDELEKGRMELMTKMELLHGSLKRDIETSRHEAHSRETVAREVLRREFNADSLPARLSDNERTTAELVTVLDATHKRVDKLEKDVAELLVGAEAIQANVQHTLGRFAAEVTNELEGIRTLYPAEGKPQPQESQQLSEWSAPPVDQLAQQVADIREALNVMHEEIKNERHANLGFAARATEFQAPEESMLEKLFHRTAEVEEVVQLLTAKTDGVISTLQQQEKEASKALVKENRDVADAGIEKRLVAMEKAMANLSMEILGEKHQSRIFLDASFTEAALSRHAGSLAADDVGRRLAAVEKALNWLKMEALGKSSASSRGSEASAEAMHIDRKLTEDVSGKVETSGAGVDGFAKRPAGVEKAVQRFPAEVIGWPSSSHSESEFSLLEGAQSSARKSNVASEVQQTLEPADVEHQPFKTFTAECVEGSASATSSSRPRSIRIAAACADTKTRSVHVQVGTDLPAAGHLEAAPRAAHAEGSNGDTPGEAPGSTDPEMLSRVECLERQVYVINAEVGIDGDISPTSPVMQQMPVGPAGANFFVPAPSTSRDEAMMGKLEQLIEVERSARRELEAELRMYVQLAGQSKISTTPRDVDISAFSHGSAGVDDSKELQAKLNSLEAHLKDMRRNASVLRNAVSALSHEVLGEDMELHRQLVPVSSSEDEGLCEDTVERHSILPRHVQQIELQRRVEQMEVHVAGLHSSTEELKGATRSLSKELAAESLEGRDPAAERDVQRDEVQVPSVSLEAAEPDMPQEAPIAFPQYKKMDSQIVHLHALIEAERLARLELETQLSKVRRFVGCTDGDVDAVDAAAAANGDLFVARPADARGPESAEFGVYSAHSEGEFVVQVAKDIPEVSDLREVFEMERERRIEFAEEVGNEFAALRQALEHERSERLEVASALSDRHTQQAAELESIVELERRALLGFAEEVGAQHSAHSEELAVQRQEHDHHHYEAHESRAAVSELQELVDQERSSRFDVIQTLGDRHKELLRFIELERSELARLISAFEVENAARQRLEVVVGSLQEQLASAVAFGPDFAKTLEEERQAYGKVFRSIEGERDSWQRALQLEEEARAEARRELELLRTAVKEVEQRLLHASSNPVAGMGQIAGESSTAREFEEEMELKLQVIAKPQAELTQLMREEVAARLRVEDKVEALWRELKKLSQGHGGMRNPGMVRAPQLAGLVRGVVNSAYIRAQGGSPSAKTGGVGTAVSESAEAAEAETATGEFSHQRVQRRLHGSAPSVLETDAEGVRRWEVDLDSSALPVSLEELARVVEAERLAKSEAEAGFPSFRRTTSGTSSVATGATGAAAEEAVGQLRGAPHVFGTPLVAKEGMLGDILAIHEETEAIIMQHVRQVTERCHARVDALSAVVQGLQEAQHFTGRLDAPESGSRHGQGRSSRTMSDTAVQGPVARAILSSAYGKATSTRETTR